MGAFTSSLIIGNNKFQIGRRYGVVLACESLAIFMAFLLYDVGAKNCNFIISFALGMQNAMCTEYSGAVLRTTHMTGIVTDIGMLLAKFVRKVYKILKTPNGKDIYWLEISSKSFWADSDLWKLKVFCPLLLGFVIGACLGQWAFDTVHTNSLVISGVLVGFCSLYCLFSEVFKKKKKFLKTGQLENIVEDQLLLNVAEDQSLLCYDRGECDQTVVLQQTISETTISTTNITLGENTAHTGQVPARDEKTKQLQVSAIYFAGERVRNFLFVLLFLLLRLSICSYYFSISLHGFFRGSCRSRG